ncbi:hypothetical protein HDE78_004231 [Rhodanobacter sp. K2T2]|uniref:hypothetical protein n=1 Tax=Rhodanobacter sp. K2T2 TaxID=2723085 RepID=UPI0015CBC4A6|nr:hypothetical protein [Rhodanobacter sp. K2T2]NYE31247.1 hypothetical protein [Rhodanobacter sp. K2T2]
MRKQQKRASDRHESAHRVAVWVVVIVCHLGLLLLFLRPAIDDWDVKPLPKDGARALQLRFFSLPLPSALPVTSSLRLVFRSPRPQAKVSTRRTTASTLQRPVDVLTSPAAAYATPKAPAQAQAGDEADGNSDGGFQQRLREAQHDSDVKGLPGSDRALVSGIHFIDPMDQGIGALARQAQRLFGIKSRQCLDVEKWRSMTPQALSARHISPDEVDRQDVKYACNAPPGLHF